MVLEIKRATKDDIAMVAFLFNAYRMFYKQPSNLEAAFDFLEQRISKNESVIFIAVLKNDAVGFVQMYPVFSSVGMKRLRLLNDLFVKEDQRKKGIARNLISRCKKLAKETNASGLMLETGKNNLEGNVLYPTEGFTQIDESNFYFWKLVNG